MWICLNEGFVSIVKHPTNPRVLLVRARVKKHLEAFLNGYTGVQIQTTPNRDYRFRVELNVATASQLLANHVLSLNYTNFKDSVEDDDLHDMYLGWWADHFALQRRLLTQPAVEPNLVETEFDIERPANTITRKRRTKRLTKGQ